MNQRPTIDASSPEADRIGFFGKVPTHGDFVSVGVGAALQNALDQWLQEGLLACEQAYGKDWRGLFRDAPPWRFAVRGGVWGDRTVAGVLLASTDRVGRSFPLVIAAQLRGYDSGLHLLCGDDTWFMAAEALTETTRTRDFTIDGFTAGLKRLRIPHARAANGAAPGGGSLGEAATLWWTIEPETGRARGFATAEPPRPADFVKLIARAAPREPEPARKEEPVRVPPEAVQEQAAPSPAPASPVKRQSEARLTVEKSYATHPGTRLSLNADSLLISESPRLYAVADGVGDDTLAAEAARATINTLTGTTPQDTLPALVQEVKGKLGRAHALLQGAPIGAGRETPRASVAVLALTDDAFAVVWAGDARCYLVRDGMMRCLTRDHVEIGLRRKLSRCVGGERQLVPEAVADRIEGGDRFLLASAPLVRALSERAIAETLLDTKVPEAAALLVQDALIANARDNLSAVVVGVDLR